MCMLLVYVTCLVEAPTELGAYELRIKLEALQTTCIYTHVYIYIYIHTYLYT